MKILSKVLAVILTAVIAFSMVISVSANAHNFDSFEFQSCTDFYVDYNKYVSIVWRAENIPKGYCIEIGSKSHEADGARTSVCACSIDNITETTTLELRVTDGINVVSTKDGELKQTITIHVDNSFWGKCKAFFRFVLNGFSWGTASVSVESTMDDD